MPTTSPVTDERMWASVLNALYFLGRDGVVGVAGVVQKIASAQELQTLPKNYR